MLAVVDDVDSDGALLAHDVIDALCEYGREFSGGGPPAVQRQQRLRARQTANVRRQYAIGHAHSTAEKMMSASFWKRRVFALCSIRPAERHTKVRSRTGSIQNKV